MRAARPRPFGLVLAGGLARRMNGADKALLQLASGTTLLQALIRRLAPQCGSVAISANGDPSRFAAFDMPIIPDAPGPSHGPLAGVLAGLEAMTRRSPPAWLLTVPGDTPFVPGDLAARLVEAAERSGRPVARASCGDRTHALVALWSFELLEPLRDALLARDVRRVTAFQAEVGVAEEEWAADPHDPFMNVNTPEDLGIARRLFQRHEAP